jgi:hypothetical protein
MDRRRGANFYPLCQEVGKKKEKEKRREIFYL